MNMILKIIEIINKIIRIATFVLIIILRYIFPGIFFIVGIYFYITQGIWEGIIIYFPLSVLCGIVISLIIKSAVS